MSLILEALRKSEAQRRLGRAPDLLTPAAASDSVRSGGTPAWPWFLAGMVLVAATAWWLGRQSPPDALSPPAAIDAAPRPSAAATLDEPESLPPTLPAASVAAPGPNPVSRPAAGLAVPPAAAGREALPDGPASAEELERLRARLEASEPIRAPSAASASESGSGADPLRRSESEPSAAGPVVAGPSMVMDAGRTPRRLHLLSAGERAALPPLKLSLHVYADGPDGRFVILDGRRLGEGERLDARVRVTEIRRDGVVVEIDGQSILVERP